MSPRWHSVAGASLHYYFSEPHARPHVAVRSKGWRCTIALDTFDVLAEGGSPPAKTVAEIIELLAEPGPCHPRVPRDCRASVPRYS